MLRARAIQIRWFRIFVHWKTFPSKVPHLPTTPIKKETPLSFKDFKQQENSSLTTWESSQVQNLPFFLWLSSKHRNLLQNLSLSHSSLYVSLQTLEKKHLWVFPRGNPCLAKLKSQGLKHCVSNSHISSSRSTHLWVKYTWSTLTKQTT